MGRDTRWVQPTVAFCAACGVRWKRESVPRTSNVAGGLVSGESPNRRGVPEDHFKLGSIMKAIISMRAGMAVFAGALLLCSAAQAQRGRSGPALQSAAYDLSKEQSVQGTVLKFIERSGTAPFGAHVIVQATSGQVDVHLGDARLLKQNNFTLAEGSNVCVVGMTRAIGESNVFLARLVQVGNNLIAVQIGRAHV